MRFVLSLLLAAVASTSASAQEATKFNGFHINMTRQELRASTPEGQFAEETKTSFELRNPKAHSEYNTHGRQCATFTLDGDSIKEMVFLKCFFGADEMPFDQYLQNLVSSYGLRMSCSSHYAPMLARAVQDCNGTSRNNEVVNIDDAAQYFSVQRAQQTPKFK